MHSWAPGRGGAICGCVLSGLPGLPSGLMEYRAGTTSRGRPLGLWAGWAPSEGTGARLEKGKCVMGDSPTA